MGSLALGEEFGAGWELWRWVGGLALGGKFGAGWGGSYKYL